MSALAFSDVRFGYGKNPVVDRLTWAVRTGAVSGIVGPNGSGKTTLFRLATGLVTPASGKIELLGQEIATMDARTVAKHVALVPQMESIVFPYPVEQMVSFGRFAHDAGPGYIQKGDSEKVEWAMELCGIAQLAERPVTELSGGELHRVLFARALAQDTPVILLDEPTAFMDIRYQVTLFDLLLKMRDDYGKTIVCVTHDLNVALTYFDDVAVLKGGTIAAQGVPSGVLTAENLRELFRIDVTVHEVGDERAHLVQLHSGYRANAPRKS